MIDIDISDYTAILDSIHDQGQELPMDAIGQLLVESVHQNFDQEGRPTAWEPRQDDNPWPILRKTGDLYHSIHYSIVGDTVYVDEGVGYGTYHDQGTSRLPARPFLLVQDEDEQAIMDIIAQSFV